MLVQFVYKLRRTIRRVCPRRSLSSTGNRDRAIRDEYSIAVCGV